MIRIGVLGAGHLGKIHIRLLKEIGEFELVGFYDPDASVSAAVAAEYQVKAWESAEDLIAQVDAVDIVTPTLVHYQYASQALKQFKHIFIEKPVTHTVEEAKSLIALAHEANVKVQVGHVERFNPAFLAVKDKELRPMFIESHRLAQWNPRGTDVSVILDLMIHDIDIVMSLIPSGVKKVSASGVAVISDSPDIANARIEFNNGAVANLTASRISIKNMRKTRMFQKNSYLSIDFLEKKAEIFHISETAPPDNQLKFEFDAGSVKKYLTFELPEVTEVNAIKEELTAFARSIQDDTETAVPLSQAAAALETAHLIIEKINNLCIV